MLNLLVTHLYEADFERCAKKKGNAPTPFDISKYVSTPLELIAYVKPTHLVPSHPLPPQPPQYDQLQPLHNGGAYEGV